MRFDPAVGPSGPGAISPYSALSIGAMLGNFGSPGTSSGNGNWPVANLAIGCPFVVPGPYEVQRLVSCSHTNISGRHFDLGIYDHIGRRLVSTGSLANDVVGISGASIHTVTPTLLVPDEVYYYAIAMDNNSDNAFAMSFSGAAWALALMGYFEAVSSFPLPSLITMAAITHDYMPPWQVRGETVGF